MTAPLPAVPTLTGLDGAVLPAVGFGTYKLNGSRGAEAIGSAIDVGYRLLDSAQRYQNEGAVGLATRRAVDAGVPRDELIVTSKLPGDAHHFQDAVEAVEESVYRSGLERLDLFLIHWPNPSDGLYVEAWQGLIEARERGLVRWIGVCNFLPSHLDRLISETGVTPAVNQIELHPYFPQAEQRAYHAEKGILTEGWSPLGRNNSLLGEDVIVRIAEEHGVTPAQVALRWQVELDVIPLPKAASPERQRENLDLFSFALTPDEVVEISALGRPDGRTFDQDPETYEEH